MTKMILGCGNPLLDISAEVPQSVLDKYGMTLNNAILAEAAHMPLYEELVANHDVTYIAGGATQNSIRVAQWFLNTTGSTSYIGSVGNDAYGKQLESSATADGVQVHYHVDKETETGTCAVLIMHKERSMVANLGAANKYDFSHLKENMHVLESAQIVYISGFFLTVSPETIMHVAEHCKATGKTLVMNLAAPFISMFFSEPLLAALEFVDIIVGNESEALAFAEKMGYEDVSPAAVAQKLAEFPSQRSTPRVAIVTQGPGETIVFTSGEVCVILFYFSNVLLANHLPCAGCS